MKARKKGKGMEMSGKREGYELKVKGEGRGEMNEPMNAARKEEKKDETKKK